VEPLWEACRVPWVPELFSAPALARIEEKLQHDRLVHVPYFAGLLTGETDALVGSFAGEPELHHPVRGRVKGVRAFDSYVAETRAWFEERDISIEDVDLIITGPRGVQEVLLHLGGVAGRVDLPVAIAADKSDGWIDELRIYYSSWPLTGRHANRPPVLQPDHELREPDVIDSYQAALAAGDPGAIVAMFESDGYVREPAGGHHVHRGAEGLGEFYERQFSNGGGIRLERCALTEDEHACALEYNVVRWGQTELPPEAGIAVYVRGESGQLAAARIYDDVDPPLDPPS
jgi:hypothetical protein